MLLSGLAEEKSVIDFYFWIFFLMAGEFIDRIYRALFSLVLEGPWKREVDNSQDSGYMHICKATSLGSWGVGNRKCSKV